MQVLYTNFWGPKITCWQMSACISYSADLSPVDLSVPSESPDQNNRINLTLTPQPQLTSTLHNASKSRILLKLCFCSWWEWAGALCVGLIPMCSTLWFISVCECVAPSSGIYSTEAHTSSQTLTYSGSPIFSIGGYSKKTKGSEFVVESVSVWGEGDIFSVCACPCVRWARKIKEKT